MWGPSWPPRVEKPSAGDHKYWEGVRFESAFNFTQFMIDDKLWLERTQERLNDLKTDCDGFQKLASESTLRGAANRKKLEAIKKLHHEYGWLTTSELKEILGGFPMREPYEPPTPARAADAEPLEGKFHKDLSLARDKLYEAIPTGEVDVFVLIKVIKTHIEDLDKILEEAS